MVTQVRCEHNNCVSQMSPIFPQPPGSSYLDIVDELVSCGRYEQAKSLLVRESSRARSSNDDPAIASAFSRVCWGLGELPQAEHYARRVAQLLPGDGHALHNLGNLLVNLGLYADALPVLEQARAVLEQSDAQMHRAQALEPVVALSNALSGLYRHDAAVALLRTALDRYQDEPRLLSNLAANLHASGNIEEALPIAFMARERSPKSLSAAELVCAMMNYAPHCTKDEVFAAHQRYGQVLAAELASQGMKPLRFPSHQSTKPSARESHADQRRLRIGFLSADLRSHAVAYFAWPIIENAGNSNASISCYHVGLREDDVSKKLRSLVALSGGVWRHLPTMAAKALADTIDRDRLDVLIDLSGHTTGHRLPVMALRPAPLCCTYFGYPNTTGVPGVDVRLVDSTIDPAGEEPWYSEQLVRLDPLFCVYQPPDDAPEVSPLPAGDLASSEARPVTFGCFGSLLKYNTQLINLWSRVLHETPHSRLVLMHHAMTEQSVRDRIRDRFVSKGIDPARIQTRPPTQNARGTLAAYSDIDIALDTWPYSGTTTVCESLWMGVPMVTLARSGLEATGVDATQTKVGDSTDRCAARVTASILRAAGLPEFIAHTQEQYVEIARTWASPEKRTALVALRHGLRQRIRTSPICDGPGFTSRFVNSLRKASNA